MADRRLRIGRLHLYVEPRDLWIGVFVAPTAIYVCPLPSLVLKWPRRGAVDRVADEAWSTVEQATRAKVAAEIRAELNESTVCDGSCLGPKCCTEIKVADRAARIAEGGDTDGR